MTNRYPITPTTVMPDKTSGARRRSGIQRKTNKQLRSGETKAAGYGDVAPTAFLTIRFATS
ncbi:hypothetical protein [Pseudovibrio sp. SPO723]|uniref:hypothetical protein n=1 Tax=Nesiotobacter zosterae TaxID=392721 RepID=UPI0029C4D81F|nr:hypothetical protein [Pseudovibrio sp. SPO723]MDX5595564.1 hypothetical protein [Pseudovibrio sp. SPO723]